MQTIDHFGFCLLFSNLILIIMCNKIPFYTKNYKFICVYNIKSFITVLKSEWIRYMWRIIKLFILHKHIYYTQIWIINVNSLYLFML